MSHMYFLFYKAVSQKLKKCNFTVLALVVDSKSIKSRRFTVQVIILEMGLCIYLL